MSLESNFTLSQKADTAIRRAATVVLLVVGVSSAILSYAGLRHLAVMAGIADSLSFLFPIVVDGMILLGSLSVLRAALARMPTWFGWMLTILGTVTSIAGNILSVENADLVSQVIHSVPPVFLCLSLETFIQLLRHRIKNTYVSEDKDAVAEKKAQPAQSEIELPSAIAPSAVVQAETPIEKEMPVQKEAPVRGTVLPTPALAVTPTVAELPRTVAEPTLEETNPVIVPKHTVVDERVADVQEDPPLAPKPVEPVMAPVTPVVSDRPVTARPTTARQQSAATLSESVELYRIILENLDDELTKTQRIAEILRVYPDAKIGDLREALGDEPTLRIDGSVRRAKELLKNGK
jgi:hypothetical protein